MIGIIEEFEALTPGWEQLVFQWETHRVERNVRNAEVTSLLRWRQGHGLPSSTPKNVGGRPRKPPADEATEQRRAKDRERKANAKRARAA